MISQGKWRATGAVFLIICFIMIVMSGHVVQPGISVFVLILYWGTFLLLLLAALYIAFLDIRYTRMQYKISERDLFRETFMTPEFRQAMQDALKEQARERKQEKN